MTKGLLFQMRSVLTLRSTFHAPCTHHPRRYELSPLSMSSWVDVACSSWTDVLRARLAEE